MDKSPDAFRTISEVADHLDTPAHVLRFWESRFPQVRPVKRAGGRRYYRPSDVALLAGIRRLLHEEGLTIRGVQKILREQGVRHVAGLAELDPAGIGESAPGVIDLAAVPAPEMQAPTGDAETETGDDGFADEWEDEPTEAAAMGAAPAAQVGVPPPAPPEPPAITHDDLPLFAGTGLPEPQKPPLTGLRGLRAAKVAVAVAPVPSAPAGPALAADKGMEAAGPEEVDLAAMLARLRGLRPGALAPHRAAIADLSARLEALRAAQGRGPRGSRG